MKKRFKLPYDPEFGSNSRRERLKKRIGNLRSIIRQCSPDNLHQLESWFDEIETTFNAPTELYLRNYKKAASHED